MNKERPGAGSLRGVALLRVPAVQAALIQSFCFLVVLGIAQGVSSLGGIQMTVAIAAILQGLMAALVARIRGLAPWWLFIQAIFPISIAAVLALQLPPAIFLIAFIASVGWYWNAFRTQVPYYPSRPPVWLSVGSLLPNDRPIQFIDVGSGLGGLVLHLSKMHHNGKFTGIEIAPLPWLVSVLRGLLTRSAARFIRGDYGRIDFARYDVVFAYLSPAAMPELWRKANAEMRAGTLLLSYEFDIPGVVPHLVSTPAGNGPPVYGWYMQTGFAEVGEAA